MKNLKLYSSVVCPFSQRTRITLLLKNIECETIERDLSKEPESWFLDLNPEGTVPTIVHEGLAIYESSIINEYLDEIVPSPHLFPSDPWQKAVSRILIDYSNRTFVNRYYELLMNRIGSRDHRLREKLLASCKYLNDRLARWSPEESYVWAEFGLADVAFAPFFRRLVLLRHFKGFEIPDTPEYRRFHRWLDALTSHPAVTKTSLSDEEYIEAYEPMLRKAA